MDEKNKLMAEFGLTADMLDFSIEDFSVEELRAKFEAMKNSGGAEPTGGSQRTLNWKASSGRNSMPPSKRRPLNTNGAPCLVTGMLTMTGKPPRSTLRIPVMIGICMGSRTP